MLRAFKLYAIQIAKHSSVDLGLVLIQEIGIQGMAIMMFSRNFM